MKPAPLFIALSLCAAQNVSALRFSSANDTVISAPKDTFADSTATALKEVTVQADHQVIKGNTVTYYPSANAKKSALDAVSLLKRMAMPSITINHMTNEITTPAGEDVKLFIDFLPAEQADIDGLRGKDVKQVDVLDYPQDPRFKAAPHVINIILRKQEFGGYTKLSDEQTFIVADDNRGSIFSRFNYKRMTYDLYVGSTFSSTTKRGDHTTKTYDFPEGTIERIEETTHSKNKQWNLPVTFRARYNSDYSQIINSIGYGFGDIYNQDQSGNLYFIPAASANGNSYRNNNSARSNTLSYDGSFYFFLPKDWSLCVMPSVSYSHNNNYYTYATDVNGFSPITRHGKDDAIYSWLYLTADKTFKQKHYLQLMLGVQDQDNDVKYSGTDNESDHINRLSGYTALTYQFTPGKKYNLGATFEGTLMRTWSENAATTNFAPTVSVWGSYNPTSKSRFNLSGSFSRRNTNYSYSNDLLVRLNEFEYRQGNPHTKPYPSFNFRLTYTYLPMNALTLAAYARYWQDNNILSVTYDLNAEKDAIIISHRNGGTYRNAAAGLNITGKFLSERLIVKLSPSFFHANLNSFFRIVKNRFEWTANAQFYAGDFSFSAYYNPKSWTVNPIGGILDSNASYYYVEGTWSKKDWIISLKALNFARFKYYGQTSRVTVPHYAMVSDMNIPTYHANFSLSVVYSFGYGKKIQRGWESGSMKNAGSVME